MAVLHDMQCRAGADMLAFPCCMLHLNDVRMFLLLGIPAARQCRMQLQVIITAVEVD